MFDKNKQAALMTPEAKMLQLANLQQVIRNTKAELDRFASKLESLRNEIEAPPTPNTMIDTKNRRVYAARRASIDLEAELKNFRKALP